MRRLRLMQRPLRALCASHQRRGGPIRLQHVRASRVLRCVPSRNRKALRNVRISLQKMVKRTRRYARKGRGRRCCRERRRPCLVSGRLHWPNRHGDGAFKILKRTRFGGPIHNQCWVCIASQLSLQIGARANEVGPCVALRRCCWRRVFRHSLQCRPRGVMPEGLTHRALKLCRFKH